MSGIEQVFLFSGEWVVVVVVVVEVMVVVMEGEGSVSSVLSL